jgi:predicted CXXCH cytochrome family protein
MKKPQGERSSQISRATAILGLVAVLASCTDPLSRHRTLSTFFDGVPDLPPVERLCEDYLGDQYREFYTDLAAKRAAGATPDGEDNHRLRSSHKPFAEKNCDGCHDFKRTNMLLRPKDQLCFMCHKDFIKGSHVHGPVSVGDCSACHLPHDSENPALLREPRSEICGSCHVEDRLAAEMHQRVIKHQMQCVDCHDPHSSPLRYFLK